MSWWSRPSGPIDSQYNRIYACLMKKSTPESFWRKVKKSDGCWIWMASRNKPSGYGQVGYQGKHTSAHRLSYYLSYGDIPSGMCVCHKCDNPFCVRPDHLFLGSPTDNMRDSSVKNRKGKSVTYSEAKDIRRFFSSSQSIGKACKKFNKSRSIIVRVLRNILKNDPDYTVIVPDKIGGKLSASDVLKIKSMMSDGVSLTRIADMYDVHLSTISLIRSEKRWKEIK